MSSSHRDYIPQNAGQFNEFMHKIIEYTNGKSHLWTNIPAPRLAALTLTHIEFDEAYHAALEKPTHSMILARQESQAKAVKELRAFVNQFLRFEPVTNFDRAEMGIPNHDTVRTDHTVVNEIVDFIIRIRTAREIKVDFWIQDSGHKAKPSGYDGAVLMWDVLDAPPANADALGHHVLASRTPFPIHFDETERGKTVYVALTWQNERGIRGQWSDIKSAIVP